MDLFLSRQEIRRRVLAVTGYATDGLLSIQDLNRLNALIENAVAEVTAQCRWLSLQRRATTRLDTDQSIISYRKIEQAYALKKKYPSLYHPGTFQTPADTWMPADFNTLPINNVGPQGILEISAWDPLKDRYWPLYDVHTATKYDQDRLEDLTAEAELNATFAGDTPTQIDAAVTTAEAERERLRGRPYSCEPLEDGLHFWPVADQNWVIRVLYTITPSWMSQDQILSQAEIDQIQSTCDGLAIVYKVAGEIFAQQGDEMQMRRYIGGPDDGEPMQLGKCGMYGKRLRDLRARQSTNESVQLDTEATFDNDNGLEERMLPRWDLGPIRQH